VSETALSREARWRLILGKPAESEMDALDGAEERVMDDALSLLFEAERQGELGESMPRLNRWMGDLRQHFPGPALHFLQKEAFDRLGINEMLLEPEMLAQLQPDLHLAGVLLQAFRSLDEPRRAAARQVIAQVADQLLELVRLPLVQAIQGRHQRRSRRLNPPWRDLDWHATIRRNLRHYQPDLQTLIPEQRLGYRPRRPRQRELIILVDQSASMTDSLIYAGLYANVLIRLPSVRLTVLAFDLRVLDLTALSHDPVDLLLGFQLGGGTDIANAMTTARRRIEQPRDALVVLISDLYEGGSEELLLSQVQEMLRAGVRMVTLLTLSQDGAPDYNPALAARFQALGVPAFACTPEHFPEVMSRAMEGEAIPLRPGG